LGASLRRQVSRRLLDLLVSITLLLLLAPLILALAVIVKVTSRGPALFRQTRAGLHGKPFVMFKFRTMTADCSDETHREYVARLLGGETDTVDGLYKLGHDPRITAVGRVLRRWSLDELPQLFNVLRGDMSLVGPRPALPWELEMFPASAASRFDVPPGLTGLWQVSGRNRLTMLQGLELDVEYVKRQSTWLDLVILVRTVPALMRSGAR
jgi:lipopolysaccharide/colanic/teichoic acid biosynthesis glycosyltransferase